MSGDTSTSSSSTRRVRPPSSKYPKLKLPSSLEFKIEEARQSLESKLGLDLSRKVPTNVVFVLNQERKLASPRKALGMTNSSKSSRPSSPGPAPRPSPTKLPSKISSPRFDPARFSPSIKKANENKASEFLKARRQKSYAKVNFEQKEDVISSAQLPFDNFKQLVNLSLLKTGTEDFWRDRSLYYSPVTSTAEKSYDWSSRELRNKTGMLSYYSPSSIEQFSQEAAMAWASHSATPAPIEMEEEEAPEGPDSELGLLEFLTLQTGLGMDEVMRSIQLSEEEACLLDNMRVGPESISHHRPKATPSSSVQIRSKHYELAGEVSMWTSGSPGTVRPGSGTPSDYQVGVTNTNETREIYQKKIKEEELEAKIKKDLTPRPVSPARPSSPIKPSSPFANQGLETSLTTIFPEKPVQEETAAESLASQISSGTTPREYRTNQSRLAVDDLLQSLSGPSVSNLRSFDSQLQSVKNRSQKKLQHSLEEEPSPALPVQPMVKLRSTLNGTLKVKAIIEDLRLSQIHLRQSERSLLPVSSKNKSSYKDR